jgi:hypothetical protein
VANRRPAVCHVDSPPELSPRFLFPGWDGPFAGIQVEPKYLRAGCLLGCEDPYTRGLDAVDVPGQNAHQQERGLEFVEVWRLQLPS